MEMGDYIQFRAERWQKYPLYGKKLRVKVVKELNSLQKNLVGAYIYLPLEWM